MAPVGEVIARYSADELPTEALVALQRQAVEDLNSGAVNQNDTLRILNLLLTIALQKLEVVG